MVKKKKQTKTSDEDGADQWEEGLTALAFLDRFYHSWLGKMTKGISPAALTYAFADWILHLSLSPGKQTELVLRALRKLYRLNQFYLQSVLNPICEECVKPLAQDDRFSHKAWKYPPYNFLYQSFLLSQQWWHRATTHIKGCSKHHSEVVNFTVRQIHDLFSPSNFLWSNPEVLEKTYRTGGLNLVEGAFNFWGDVLRDFRGDPPAGAEKFVVGKNIACTKGEVIFRNDLIELLYYKPLTKTVYAEPVLLVPAWIMKYYILDLSPHNSLARYLVEHGFSVFMISWKNPSAKDALFGMEDYQKLGVADALDVIEKVTGSKAIHGAGYCLGGTLLSIAAATFARDREERLKTMTLFASQTDYSDAGELTFFIDESQVSFLEDMMWRQGYLDAKQISGAFQLLRSKDLIFSKNTKQYLLGEREELFDVIAWNADATRLPYKMHSEYLRKLFIENALAEGKFEVGGKTIALHDIRLPIFCVATTKDHISPWKSVYKIHLEVDSEVTFVLTNGGHNVGIISEPGNPKRAYQISTRGRDEYHLDPNEWAKETPVQQGSWWPAWIEWLEKNSTRQRISPPKASTYHKIYPKLMNTPGSYVFLR